MDGQKLMTNALFVQLEALTAPEELAGAYLNEDAWNEPD